MKRPEYFIIYFLSFVFIAVLLRITGLITFTSLELLSFIFVFAGLATAFYSFGKDRKGLLFISSSVFLIGVLIFINSRFDLEDSRILIFPSTLFILCTGFLLLFLDDTANKVFLGFSLFFLISGLLFMLWFRSSTFAGFFPSLVSIIESYWLILLVSAGLIFIFRKRF